MTDTSSAIDLQCTDILMHLGASDASRNVEQLGAPAAAVELPDQAPRLARLEAELASTKVLLEDSERALMTEQRRMRELQQQLAAIDVPASHKTGSGNSQNSFDIVLTLSSERETALRERKLYKDRAAKAENSLAQLESDLVTAQATAKLQAERANKLAARCDELQRNVSSLGSDKLAHERRITQLEAQLSSGHSATNDSAAEATLRQLLQERDKRIQELEIQLTERAGTPTMFGGELERFAPGAFPSVVYALESLDASGKLYKLARSVNTVGRSTSNDIQLDSSSVSRYHARLLNKPDGVWLVDLQSINGCHVNDRRTTTELLSEGDLVVIGECRFRFSTLPPSHA